MGKPRDHLQGQLLGQFALGVEGDAHAFVGHTAGVGIDGRVALAQPKCHTRLGVGDVGQIQADAEVVLMRFLRCAVEAVVAALGLNLGPDARKSGLCVPVE